MTDIVNPADIAIALKYDGQHAPTITAKGRGDLAQDIIDLAIANDIPFDHNPELVKILSSIPLGDEIPEALYIAVAEVIAFAYLLSGKVPDNYTGQAD
ncbi:EscU/YscU/HrcU family type III secretion system export apparatus switch protein [Cycloclasticus sp. P1]|uniref:EscU/YscU/HrcU family type III secretion system export apparatus switch protein n=1 Tax=Cycloclasticus sp. (strain P1) TaxID=385025 RepID=UPI000286ADEC|nr:EscU/YscU/HrcU family type III secretion system export apparatus switch protein [Cycloclasticus sp. P1]AFT67563.1 Cytoplasmic domain of flagellar protein FhlB-like protein [Cycloclasticus sp. P1]